MKPVHQPVKQGQGANDPFTTFFKRLDIKTPDLILRKIFLTRFSDLSSSSSSLAIDVVNILRVKQVEDLAWSCLRLR